MTDDEIRLLQSIDAHARSRYDRFLAAQPPSDRANFQQTDRLRAELQQAMAEMFIGSARDACVAAAYVSRNAIAVAERCARLRAEFQHWMTYEEPMDPILAYQWSTVKEPTP